MFLLCVLCFQDPFWKVCMKAFKERKQDLSEGSVDYEYLATKAAKQFAKNLPAL